MDNSEDIEEKMYIPVQLAVETDKDKEHNIQETTYVPNRVGKRTNLYITAAAVNILSLLAGISFNWMSTMQSILQGEDSPVGQISDMDVSWLAAIVHLARFCTIMFYMQAIDRFGRKNTGYLVAAPFVLCYGMTVFTDSIVVLYCARFIAGMGAGGACILAPAYVSDIAEDVNKGRLGVLFGLSLNLGFTFTYVVGYIASYIVFHECCLAISIGFAFIFYWLPESPLYLMITGKDEQAKKVLRWLRNGEDCDMELERMKIRAQDVLEKKKHKISLTTLFDRPTFRGLLIGVGLMANQQLSGNAPVLTYTVSIFEAAGSTISPNLCSIWVGILTTAGTVISSVVIERSGRRFLLIASNIVFTISLGVLGTYFYLRHLGWQVEGVGWLPLTCLSAHVFTTGLGFSSLPFTVVTEVVSARARGAVQTIMLMFLSVCVFTILFGFGPLASAIGQYGCFWFFSAACAVCTACVYLAMPETKNRSLEDVIVQLKSDRYVHSVLSWSKKKPENVELKLEVSLTKTSHA